MNFGVWHNGNTNLPLKETDEGIVIPDASLAEMHEDRRRVAVERIEHTSSPTNAGTTGSRSPSTTSSSRVPSTARTRSSPSR
jgi:hypothetical protein